MPRHPSVVASLLMNNGVAVVDMDTNDEPSRLRHQHLARSIEWCPQRESTLACGTENGSLYIWGNISQLDQCPRLVNSPIIVPLPPSLNSRIFRGIRLRTPFSEWLTQRELGSMTYVRDRSYKSFQFDFPSPSEFPSHRPARFFDSTPWHPMCSSQVFSFPFLISSRRRGHLAVGSPLHQPFRPPAGRPRGQGDLRGLVTSNSDRAGDRRRRSEGASVGPEEGEG